MSKMGTKFLHGRKWTRVVALSLLFAVLIASLALSTVSARLSWLDEFSIKLCGEEFSSVNDWWNPESQYGKPAAAEMECATTQSLNLFTDGIFVAKSLNQIKWIKIFSSDITRNSDVQISLDNPEGDKQWDVQIGNQSTTITYRPSRAISTGDFNSLMAKLNVSMRKGTKATYGDASVTIFGYADPSEEAAEVNAPRSSYTCKFHFYSFAEGEANPDSATVDYKGDYDADFDAVGAVGEVPVVSADAAGGKVDFDMKFTSFGGLYGAKKVTYGYQIKENSEPWSSKVPTIIVNSDAPIETKTWKDMDKAVRVSIPASETDDYLKAGVDYDVRGVVVSDGKTQSPKYTDTFSVRYDKPQINSFNVGNTTKSYLGGTDTMQLSMLAVFADKNSLDKTYTRDGVEYTGPALKASVYFTPDRNFVTQENGDVDKATWYALPQLTEVKRMQDDGKISTSFEYQQSYKLPSRLSDLDDTISPEDAKKDRPIDSRNCAFKIVVTDLATGYSVYTYSDPVIVDSSEPKNLSVTGQNSLGTNVSLELADEMKAVGGVTLKIGGATDDTNKSGEAIRDDIGLGKGSGIKEYSYSMYYLSSEAAKNDPALQSKSVAEILKSMAAYRENSYGKSEYTNWTSLSATDNFAELSMAKDGYYRVDVKVTDNAGRTQTVSKYVRIDLTVPNKPVVALGKEENGQLKPYDNRTYSTSTVWLFAYSEPLTGKTLQTYQYSTDGGLTWTDMTAMKKDEDGNPTTTPQVANSLKKVPFVQTDNNGAVQFENGIPKPSYTENPETGKSEQTTSHVTVYDYKNSYAESGFDYHAAVSVSGMGNNDYTSILVRAVDDLGNTSLVSDEIVMRTIASKPAATGVLRHSGIEVALALGNTTMQTSEITPYVKNAAALKINAKYYGVNSTEYKRIANHICKWYESDGVTEDASCTGECGLPDCPYKAGNNPNEYEYFTPAMVNVQGMSGADANDQSKFNWVRFDHTAYNHIKNEKDQTIQIPTVAYTTLSGGTTNLKADTNAKTWKNESGKTYYTQVDPKGRVLYLAQSTLNVDANDLPTDELSEAVVANGMGPTAIIDQGTWGQTIGTATGMNHGTYAWYMPNAFTVGTSYMDFTVTAGQIDAFDTYTAAGHIYKENLSTADGTKTKSPSMARRIYHMVDMSNAKTKTGVKDPINGYADLSAEGDMSSIAGINGYVGGCPKDWLFLYNDQPGKKEIWFTIDDRNMSSHSSDFGGFLFNTTIRQSAKKLNTDGKPTWRLSGYLFMAANKETTWGEVDNQLWIVSINDVNLDHLADGSLIKGGVKGATGNTGAQADYDEIAIYLLDDCVGTPTTKKFADGGSMTTVAYSQMDTNDLPKETTALGGHVGELGVRNYKLVTEGNYTSVYMYNSEKKSVPLVDANGKATEGTLKYIFSHSNGGKEPIATVMPNSAATKTEYRKIIWKKSLKNGAIYSSPEVEEEENDGSKLYTPRPMVDGIRIGTDEAQDAKLHTDSNCYGFGPMVGARSTGHAYGCFQDSRMQFSNISMTLYSGRKLSEVVTEPQWGSGQSKFIANLSDDSVEDFHDPVLSAQVRWRLNNDNAKFIGWGTQRNESETTDFLNRIEGTGTYVVNNDKVNLPFVKNDNDKNPDLDQAGTQIDEIAEYITKEYYNNLGLDSDSATCIKNQAASVKKGSIFTLENIAKMDFRVISDGGHDYNASSANPDFPSGRWYMVHDTLGYETDTDPLSGKYTDGLNLNSITRPGRYTVYFAPSSEAVANNALNPEDAVFDFIVNQTPEAQFTGNVDASGNVTIEDVSRDRDVASLNVGSPLPNSKDAEYTINGQKKKYNDCKLNGITKREWKFDITTKIYLDQNGNESPTKTDNYKVKELYVSGDWKVDNDPQDNTGACPNGRTLSELTAGKVTRLGNNDIMTVYERVTDTVAMRVAYNAKGQKAKADEAVTEYRYESQPVTSMNLSRVCQQNLSMGVSATFAPLAAFLPSSPYMYDMAEGETAQITITRNSSQPQQKNITCSWAVDPTGTGKNYIELTENDSHDWLYNGTPVLKCIEAPTPQGTGKWTMSKTAVQTLVGSTTGKAFALRMTEKLKGKTAEDIASMGSGAPEKWISDHSGRTITYTKDVSAPTSQTVSPTTKQNDGSEGEYQASNYLDVTNSSQYINLKVGGSKDNEGAVKGYAYYFYDRDTTKTVNASGYETQYYYMGSDDNLYPADSLTDAFLKNKQYHELDASGGDIKITGAIMKPVPGTNIDRRPTYSVNVAIFAYDTQTGMGTITGGNEAQKTRVEDIKLSTSSPVKPEITATTTLNKVLAHVGNDYGFEGGTAEPTYDASAKKYTPGNPGTDLMTTDETLDYFTNTNVTLQFTPRQRGYTKDKDGNIEPSSSSQDLYYEDIYGRADLTGSAAIVYTIETKKTEEDTYKVLTLDGVDQKDISMSPALNVTLTEEGWYRVTAQVRNGAGTLSGAQSVTFTIDKTAPDSTEVVYWDTSSGSPKEYAEGSWAKSVRANVDKGHDTNVKDAHYEISRDNGASWELLGEGLGPQVYTDFPSGQFTVLVKAVDKAGNEKIIGPKAVRIDQEAPNVLEPTVTAAAVTRELFSSYIVTVGSSTGHGEVHAMNEDGTMNFKDTSVSVPTGESMRFYIMPANGYKIASVTYGGTDVTDKLVYDESQRENYYLAQNVKKDASLNAEFVEESVNTESYMYSARRTENSTRMAALRASQAGMRLAGSPEDETPLDTVSRVADTVTSAVSSTPAGTESSEPNSSSESSGSSNSGSSGGTEESGGGTGEEAGGTNPDPGTNPDEGGDTKQLWEIDAKAGSGGTIITDPADVVEEGTPIVCTIKPGRDYNLVSLRVNGSDIEEGIVESTDADGSKIYTYTIPGEQVMKKMVIRTTFALIERRALRVSVENEDLGQVNVLDGDGIIANGDGTYEVREGATVSIEMIPSSESYMIDSLKVNGAAVPEVSKIHGTYIHNYVMEAFVPQANEADTGVEIAVRFEISDQITAYGITASVAPGSEDMGTITPSGMTLIPDEGSRQFVMRPYSGYHVEEVAVAQSNGEGGAKTTIYARADNSLSNLKLLPDGAYAYTFESVQDDNSTIMVTFARNVYSVSTISDSSKGTVSVSSPNTDSLSLDAVEEGTHLIFWITPKNGFKIKNVVVNLDGVETMLGSIGKYEIENVHNNIVLKPIFEERLIERLETTHSITATASKVSDNNQLAAQPYRFQITDGTMTSDWSPWSESNTITYGGLLPAGAKSDEEMKPFDPNKQYWVNVEVRDAVGNISTGISGSVYTRANIPETVEARCVDSKNNDVSKDVELEIDPNNNPTYTEYMVYYSTSQSMTNMQVANATEEHDGWEELKNGVFTIHGLTPGLKYHLQVVARNKLGFSTELNNRDIPSVILSPASPPEYSFYFEEQESPTSGIKLNWEAPSGSDVKTIEIYRDGMHIADCPITLNYYIDPYANIRGDSICTYSYAYVNSAGTGSSRTAVSEEYYKGYLNSTKAPMEPEVSGAPEPSETPGSGYDAELDEKYQKMVKLVKDTGVDYFTETMTYPKFPRTQPKTIELEYAVPRSTESSSGAISAYVSVDNSTVARWQKYKLGLIAYDKIEHEDGSVEYQLVTDHNAWDPTGQNIEPKETVVASNKGAHVLWEGLNTNYEYKVYISEISSNGWPQREGARIIDGYDGQEEGIEGTLQKRYVVDQNGYHTEFKSNLAQDLRLQTAEGVWTDEDSLAYTQDIGWGNPVVMDYIKFNKSPEMKEASDIYAGNGAEKRKKDSNGENYLLVDQGMSDMTFHLNTVAWDKDGSPTGKSTVRGELAGVTGSVSGDFELLTSMSEAEKSPYAVIFDGKRFPTGVYTDGLKFSAFDGYTESALEMNSGFKVVINRAAPTLTVVGGMDNRKVESGKTYTQSILEATSDLAVPADETARMNLISTRLIVMSEQYDSLFGGHTLDVLEKNLMGGTLNSTYVENAKQLLAEKYGEDISAYLSGSGLSKDGVLAVIEAVNPPITGYFETTEDVYHTWQSSAPDKFRVETNGMTTYYWVEQEFALNNGLCTWLTKVADGQNKVTGTVESSPHKVELVANFGGNISRQIIKFDIVPKPSVVIPSQKYWAWVSSAPNEYKVYQNMDYTIADIAEKYKDCYDPQSAPIGESDLTQPAYKPGNQVGTYLIYKLCDRAAQVYHDNLSGKVRVETGIYDKFEELGIIRSTDKDAINTDMEMESLNELPSGAVKVIVQDLHGNANLSSGEWAYYAGNLTADTTYFLWTYYKVPGGNYFISSSYIALTTAGDYQIGSYGFESLWESHKEKEASSSGNTGEMELGFSIKKSGSVNAQGRIVVTAKYLAADEFGNIQVQKDSDGNMLVDSFGDPIPVEITEPEQLSAAKKTFNFANGTDQFSTFVSSTYVNVPMILRDTDDVQGHMVVRLSIAIADDEDSKGYNEVQDSLGKMDIFIQDNESEVQTYRLGLDNSNNQFKEVYNKQGKLAYYEYEFPGMAVGDPASQPLEITYLNAGTGTLDDITATIYTSLDSNKVESDEFVISTPASPTALYPSTGPSDIPWGEVNITPAANLADKEHIAYICLSAKHMEEEDYIWIRVRQVVGQSTLRGKIYAGAVEPTREDERTGVATIYLYPGNTTHEADGSFTQEPLYVTQSAEYGGYYEIPNIINNSKYYIVVKRDGFLMFDGVPGEGAVRRQFVTSDTSQVYNFSLRLMGGDATGDMVRVDEEDEALFKLYFNKTYDRNKEPVTKEDFEIRRCDYNLDGAVNALDRAVLVSSFNKTSNHYKYSLPVLETSN